MFDTILVPLDGSELAEQTLPYAAELARVTGSRVCLLHLAPPMAPTRFPEIEREAQAMLDRATEFLRVRSVEAEATLDHATADAAGRAILERARAIGAGLILLSTHGRGGIGRWIFGSVAEQLIRRTDLPLLIVPARAARDWPESHPRRLLVPLDGSPFAEEALDTAVGLAARCRGRLVLVSVVGPGGRQSGPLPTATAASLYLRQVADRLRSTWLEVELDVATGPAVGTITSLARRHRADLLVMATHGASGLRRTLLGGVATGLLAQSARPILLVRPLAVIQQAAADDAAAEVAAGSDLVELRLSGSDLDLVQAGLRGLTSGIESADPARQLLARLEHLGPED
jgi:nucleotide-binding universal stress UspA family protein